MKKLIRIKETLACGVKRYGRMLSLLVAFTALSSGAWGTTYYVYGGTAEAASSWSTTPIGQSESLTFTITNSDALTTGRDYFIGISTRSNGYWEGTTQQLFCDTKESSGSAIDYVEKIENNDHGGNCRMVYIKYKLKESVSSITITLTQQGDYNTCNTTIPKYKYSISAGGTPTPTTVNYALGGWLNNGGVDSYQESWKLTETGAGTGVYAGVFKFTAVHNNSQYLWIIDSNGNKWGRSSKDYPYTENIEVYKGSTGGKIQAPSNTTNYYRVTFTPTSATSGTLTWDAVAAATIWMGDYPEQEGTNITGNVFLAQTGGMEISSIKVYYSKDAAPDLNSNNYVEIEKPVGGFVCGQLYEYALTDMCLIGSGNYQIQAVAENASGKANSDIVSYNNFVCCPGIISSFKIEPTAKYVMPGELVEFKTTIQGGGANPTYVWKEKVGSGEETALVSTASNLSYVVPQGLEGGTQVTVSVTVTGSNCPDDVRTEQALLTVCNTPVISSLEVEGTPAAWTATTINASVSNADKAEWTSMPNAELTGKSLSGATFRGGVTSTGDPYKVTIKAIENSCGNSVEQTIDVTINPDTEQCN